MLTPLSKFPLNKSSEATTTVSSGRTRVIGSFYAAVHGVAGHLVSENVSLRLQVSSGVFGFADSGVSVGNGDYEVNLVRRSILTAGRNRGRL